MTAENVKPLLPTLHAGNRPAGIIPQTFDDCYRLGKMMAISGMVPDAFRDNPEACTIAIMQGLEVGLSPMAAVQSIAVINGRPTLWGDGALGVVRASGLLEWIKEWTEGDTAYCEAKRRGEPEPIRRSFSDADAKAAGLTNKKGPWQDYRPRMRQMRARGWTLRDGFADVLKGLRIAEEEHDTPMRDVTPPASKPAPLELPDIPDIEPDKQGAISGTQGPDKAPDMSPKEPDIDPDKFLAALADEIATCSNMEELAEIGENNAGTIERLPPKHRKKAEKMLKDAAE